jgi:hypothetical protein
MSYLGKVRYADDCCGKAKPIADHAKAAASACYSEVERLQCVSAHDVREALARMIEPYLREAFAAGHRLGMSEVADFHGSMLRAQIEKALGSLQAPTAGCPHCVNGRSRQSGADCAECGGTGRLGK